ncbi:MAG: NADPH:quinone reductase [Actinomycetota bacterium]|jgi:NADPH2:quinone reductase
MRAVVCKEFGPPSALVVTDVPEPEAGRGQVVLDVHACAVNFPDVLIIQDKYQFKPSLPFSPGGEVSGIVRALGPDVDGPVKVGDRVIASTGWNGMTEQVAAAASALIPVPDNVDLIAASGLLTTYGTTHYALKDRAKLQPGETLLVLGAAGGVGLAAVELGRAMGARVIAAASSEDKLELCRERGADATINYATEDLKTRTKELTDGHGVNVIYDPVGGDYSEQALRAIAWEGRFLVIGFAAGDIPRIPLNLALLKSCDIVGVFWGAFTMREPEKNRQNIAELLQMWSDGKISLYVSERFPLERGAEAIAHLADRKAKGKIVVVTPAGEAASA